MRWSANPYVYSCTMSGLAQDPRLVRACLLVGGCRCQTPTELVEVSRFWAIRHCTTVDYDPAELQSAVADHIR